MKISCIFKLIMIAGLFQLSATNSMQKRQFLPSFIKNIINPCTLKKACLYGASAAVVAGLTYHYFPQQIKDFLNPDHVYQYGDLTKQISITLIGDSLKKEIADELRNSIPHVLQYTRLINADGIASAAVHHITKTFDVSVPIPLASLNYIRNTLFSGIINSSTIKLGVSAAAGLATMYGINTIKNAVHTVTNFLSRGLNKEAIKKGMYIGVPALVAGGIIGYLSFTHFPNLIKNFLNSEYVYDDIKTEAVLVLTKRSLQECIFTHLKENITSLSAWSIQKISQSTLEDIAAQVAQKVSKMSIKVAVSIPMDACNQTRSSLFSGVINHHTVRYGVSALAGGIVAKGVGAVTNRLYEASKEKSSILKKITTHVLPACVVAGFVGYGLYRLVPDNIYQMVGADVSDISTSFTLTSLLIKGAVENVSSLPDNILGRGIKCALNVSLSPLRTVCEQSSVNMHGIRIIASVVGAAGAGCLTAQVSDQLNSK